MSDDQWYERERSEAQQPGWARGMTREAPADEQSIASRYLELAKGISIAHRQMIGAAVAVLVLLGGCTWIYQAFIDTDPQAAVIGSRRWERQIEIEQFRTIRDRDWSGSEPADAREYDRRREVHHYDQVPYSCTKTRTVTSYDSNGRSTSRTETYTDTCYRSDPVYRTRIYYEVDRWVTGRWVTSQGSEIAPFWPALPTTLNTVAVLGNEREGNETKERYEVEVECSKCDPDSWVEVSLSEWRSMKPATPVIAKVTARGTVRDVIHQETP